MWFEEKIGVSESTVIFFKEVSEMSEWVLMEGRPGYFRAKKALHLMTNLHFHPGLASVGVFRES